MPKPLVPVAGKPMIEYALDKLRAYGIREIIINVSHLKEQLTAYLSAFNDLTIKISEEAEPLETGGGLKKALPLLGNDPFFTINSDILWTDEQESALDRLTRYWDDAKMDFLLLTQPKAKAIGHDQGEDHLFIKPGNTFGWNEQEAPYIIAGIGIMHPRVLSERSRRKVHSQNPLARSAQAKPPCLPAASWPMVPNRHHPGHQNRRKTFDEAGRLSLNRTGTTDKFPPGPELWQRSMQQRRIPTASLALNLAFDPLTRLNGTVAIIVGTPGAE